MEYIIGISWSALNGILVALLWSSIKADRAARKEVDALAEA